MQEVSVASPMVPNLDPLSFTDMVFSMAGVLTTRINGIDVAESVLERNKRLAGLMVERNVNLP